MPQIRRFAKNQSLNQFLISGDPKFHTLSGNRGSNFENYLDLDPLVNRIIKSWFWATFLRFVTRSSFQDPPNIMIIMKNHETNNRNIMIIKENHETNNRNIARENIFLHFPSFSFNFPSVPSLSKNIPVGQLGGTRELSLHFPSISFNFPSVPSSRAV